MSNFSSSCLSQKFEAKIKQEKLLREEKAYYTNIMFSNIAIPQCDQRASGYKDFLKETMMLQDVVHPLDQLPLDDISSPISCQLVEFCDKDLFKAETLTNSEVASCSDCCYEDNSSYTTNLSIQQDIMYNSKNDDSNGNTTTTTTTTTSTTALTANNNSNLSILFDYSQDEIDNDISASIDFSPYANAQQDQFDFSSLQPQGYLTDVIINGLNQYPPDPVAPLMVNSLPPVFEEDCLSSVPSFLQPNPSSPSPSFLDINMASYFPGNLPNAFYAENSGVFAKSTILMGSELQPHDQLEYQGDNGGTYCPDSVQRRLINSGDLQGLNNEREQLANGGGTCTALASEMSSLEESAFKVGKLSVEQRKEKIHRYMKKRNERNFSKKIKYACRKTLADSRPRVRGRFAKNEKFGDNLRRINSIHEDDDDEDLQFVTVKEEDNMVDSSDIFAHISGVNSFKCNYSIPSWI